MNDFPSRMHRALYDGKSDKANAPENDNPDFRAGYAFATESDAETSDAITDEWERRGCPCFDTPEFEAFREWKRGFWAARLQKSWLKARMSAE